MRSQLGPHLASRVNNLRSGVRQGLAMRHSIPWSAFGPLRIVRDGQGAPWGLRKRFHYGIRSRISKLRKARALLAEFRHLQSLQRRA